MGVAPVADRIQDMAEVAGIKLEPPRLAVKVGKLRPRPVLYNVEGSVILDGGARFDAALRDPLDLGFAEVKQEELGALGTQPPPDSVAHVRLLTALSSASTKQGETVEAVVTAPVFSLEHKLLLQERVRRRAQELYRLRGDRPGSAVDDWRRAEEEIRREAEEQAVERSLRRLFPGQRFSRTLRRSSRTEIQCR